MESARMTFSIEGPSVCAIAMASTICGTARKMSETRISASPSQLCRQPETRQIGTPTQALVRIHVPHGFGMRRDERRENAHRDQQQNDQQARRRGRVAQQPTQE